MKNYIFCVLCLFIVSVEAVKPFKWYYCNPKKPGIIRIKKLEVSPSPLPSPGKFYVTMEEETLAPMNWSRVELSVKKLGLINVPVPCITKFGSCTYKNTCTLLDDMEKHNYAGLLGPIATALKKLYHKKGLSYKCPVPRQVIKVTKEEFPLPATSSVMKTFLQVCKSNKDCPSGKFCDKHYNLCDTYRKLGEPCREDSHCQADNICMFGQCEKPPKEASKGARCDKDSDCHPNTCCVRRHGEKICQPKLKLGQKCYVPKGGLDYSLNQLCPCAEGLVCRHSSRNKPQIRLSGWRYNNFLEHLRCTT